MTSRSIVRQFNVFQLAIAPGRNTPPGPDRAGGAVTPEQLFERLKNGSLTEAPSAGVLYRTWNRQWAKEWTGSGHHQRGDDAGFGRIPQQTWVDLFRTAGYHEVTITAPPEPATWDLRAAEPPNGVHAFRAAPHDRAFGASWTPCYDLACRYARRDGAGRQHVVNMYHAWLPRECLLGHIFERHWQWQCVHDEYVVDASSLETVEVIAACVADAHRYPGCPVVL